MVGIFYKSDDCTKCTENSDIKFYLVKSLIRYENPTNVSKWSGPICTTYLESIFLISLCTRYLLYQHKWNYSAVFIIILKHLGALNAMALFAHRNPYFLELCNPFLGISTKELDHNGNKTRFVLLEWRRYICVDTVIAHHGTTFVVSITIVISTPLHFRSRIQWKWSNCSRGWEEIFYKTP